MNVHETRFRSAAADEAGEQVFVDRSPSFLRRTAAVAATATADAEAVDREARFPKAAYMTEIEFWRELEDDHIEFVMRRLPTAD